LFKLTHRLEHLTLILTYACQLKCKMCSQVEGRTNATNSNTILKQLPFDLVKQRLEESEGLRSVYLHGGEPLLHQDIGPLLKYLSDRGLSVSFSTNGLLLKKFVVPIVESRVNMVSISMDSYLADVHDSIRGMDGCMSKALEGIDCLLRERKTTGSALPRVKIHFTITPDNYRTMIDYYDYFAVRFPEVDIIKFHFPRFINDSMASEYVKIMHNHFGTEVLSGGDYFSTGDLNKGYETIDSELIYNQLRELLGRPKVAVLGPLAKDEIRRYFYGPHVRPNNRKCACFDTFAVQPSGQVVSCADYPDYVLGNIHEQTLSEVWTGMRAKRWRRFLATRGNFGVLTKCSLLYKTVYAPVVKQSATRRLFEVLQSLTKTS